MNLSKVFCLIDIHMINSILIKHDCLSGGIIHVTAFSGIFGTGVDHNFSFLNIKGD